MSENVTLGVCRSKIWGADFGQKVGPETGSETLKFDPPRPNDQLKR